MELPCCCSNYPTIGLAIIHACCNAGLIYSYIFVNPEKKPAYALCNLFGSANNFSSWFKISDSLVPTCKKFIPNLV